MVNQRLLNCVCKGRVSASILSLRIFSPHIYTTSLQDVAIHRQLHCSSKMAKSMFEYVRQFETPDRCLLNTWIVVRIDGKNFHKYVYGTCMHACHTYTTKVLYMDVFYLKHPCTCINLGAHF